MPPLRPELRSFVDWVSNYTLSSRGMVLRMCLRMGEHLGAERERVGVWLAGAAPQRMTSARRRVLELLADGMVRSKGEAAREAGVSAGVIDGLLDDGALEAIVLPPEPVAEKPDPDFTRTDFSPVQREAASALTATLAKGGYSVTLIDGVTGSGKTEVYFEAVADTMPQGRQALMLMPEIALTGSFLDRFADRFGTRPAEWHSEISSARAGAHLARRSPTARSRVVVGARSALFLPYADLGLIVVDEEHDARLQAGGWRALPRPRHGGGARPHRAHFPVVLASATPSIETEVNARRGRYRRLALPERSGGQRLPSIEAIDLRRDPPPRGRFIVAAAGRRVERSRWSAGEQALLFLNRRGYAPLTLCRACGFRFSCPNCDAWLVDHRFRRQLVCHHCGFAMPHPAALPELPGGQTHSPRSGPASSGWRRRCASCFPARACWCSRAIWSPRSSACARNSPTSPPAASTSSSAPRLVAKGHNFPMLNLVGVVDADLGLSNGDPRAAERTFQLLHQVIGRAGRDAGGGRGYLQTHQPEHPVMRALIAQDRKAFYDAEIEVRERTQYPPFGRLASLVVSGPDKPAAESFARSLARAAPAREDVRVLGPAEAPLGLVRGRHRLRLLVKAPRSFDLSAYLREWLADGPKPKANIKLEIDVDPQSFL